MKTTRAAALFAVSAGLTFLAGSQPSVAAQKGHGALRVASGTVNGVAAPLGVDDTSPALSWKLRSTAPDQRQTAYRVLVWEGDERRVSDVVWDSGVVRSDRSRNVEYAGRALRSEGVYSWSVQVWDSQGRPSKPGPRWTLQMGVLDASAWQAHWIGAGTPELSLSGASWIWAGADPAGFPPQTRYFRRDVEIPAGGIAQAQFLVTADDRFRLYVNGERVAGSPEVVDAWRQAVLVDLTAELRPGVNTIAVEGINTNAQPNGGVLERGPAGLIGRLRVTMEDGTVVETVTDASWKAFDNGGTGWSEPGFDDSGWPAATVQAPYGSGPWASNVTVPTLRTLSGASWLWYPEGPPGGASFPAGSRYFRRSVEIPAGAAVREAALLITADDRFEVYVNGTEVARSPSGRDAWKQAVGVDLAAHLRTGANTLAVEAENDSGPAGLIARLHVALEDGTVIETPSDGAWKASNTEADGWSEPGFDDSDWPGALVQAPYGAGPWGSAVTIPDPPSPYLRKEFEVTERVERATLSVSALGFYQARLNGRPVTRDLFTPGFTDFDRRVEYLTYDVTRLLRRGRNTLGALLGPGWYSGFVPVVGRHHYGTQPWLYAQLRIRYADGTSSTIGTDGSWKTAPSPVRSSDIFMGEAYDARVEKPGWDRPGYDDSSWRPAVVHDTVTGAKLDSRIAPSVRTSERLRPVEITEPEPGRYVIDFGQNIAGWLRLRVEGPRGTTVTMRHAEVLNPDGRLYTAALRAAEATDTFTLAGTGEAEVFEPHFTYHGFRYAELTGFPGRPTRDSVTAIAATANIEDTLEFRTSDGLINQLQSNIEWTQRNSAWSFFTDCHQRDERLPWVSGDIEQYIPTATLNAEADEYFTNWMHAVDDAQRLNGAFPDTAPDIGLTAGNAGWSDAAVTIPYTLWKRYGNTRVISEHWPALTRYMDFLEARSPGYLAPGITYGDWLFAGEATAHDLIATAYFAHSSDLMAQMAGATGRPGDAARYRRLFENVRAAFQRAYVEEDGSISGNSQTGYVMALAMDLLPEDLRQDAAARLVANIEARGMHLTTGFLGTGKLLPVLTEAGHAEVAYALIQQTTYPSWGYQIGRGATTIWERWDSVRPDGTFQDPGMNSFNHPAFGSVGEWMYQSIGGIAQDPEHPGFQRFVVRPVPGGGLTEADVAYDSPYGRIASRWKRSPRKFKLDVEVPPNATATVHVPAGEATTVAGRSEGIRRVGTDGGYVKYAVGSGRHTFITRMPAAQGKRR